MQIIGYSANFMKMMKLNNLSFEVTTNCNQKCSYCYNIWKDENGNNLYNFNSYNQAKRTLNQINKSVDYKHITFTGGEPFLLERFPELVLKARLSGKSVSIITNGSAAKFVDYEMIHKLGISHFQITLNADNAAVHDSMSGISGSWEKTLLTIQNLIKLKSSVVGVIVLTAANYPFLAATINFLWSLGIRRIMLNRYNISKNGVNHLKTLLLTANELKNAFQVADMLAYKLNLTISSNVCTPACIIQEAEYQNISFGHCSPIPEKRPITIDLLGNLRLCNHSPIVAGNIFEEKMEKILYSDYAKTWYQKPDYCADCVAYEKCRGGCRAASEQLGQSILMVDPLVVMGKGKPFYK